LYSSWAVAGLYAPGSAGRKGVNRYWEYGKLLFGQYMTGTSMRFGG